jgi:hypothetical protein
VAGIEFYTEKKRGWTNSSLSRWWRNDQRVTFKNAAELPHKFERVHTGNRLGTAIDYMNEVGFENIQNKSWNC